MRPTYRHADLPDPSSLLDERVYVEKKHQWKEREMPCGGTLSDVGGSAGTRSDPCAGITAIGGALQVTTTLSVTENCRCEKKSKKKKKNLLSKGKATGGLGGQLPP